MIEAIAQVAENATQMTGVTSQTAESIMQTVFTVFGIFAALFGLLLIFILGRLFKIQETVSKLNGIHEASMIKENSPLSLTKTGEEILTESGAKGYIDSHKDRLLKEFENVKNAFDIQQEAREVMKGEFAKPDFDKVKDYLYDKGKEFDEAVAAAGVYLRDIVLKERENKEEGVQEVAKK